MTSARARANREGRVPHKKCCCPIREFRGTRNEEETDCGACTGKRKVGGTQHTQRHDDNGTRNNGANVLGHARARARDWYDRRFRLN